MKIKYWYFLVSIILFGFSLFFFLALFDIVFLDAYGLGFEGALLLTSSILFISSAVIFLKGLEKDK